MLWDAGLVLAIAVCAGIVVDLLARPALPTNRSVAALAFTGLLWAGGDLLLRHAQDAEQILFARRVLFAGVCALGPCMLHTALRLHRLRREGVIRLLLLAAVGFEVLVYGTLYSGRPDLLISGAPSDPTRGVLFPIHAVVQWCLIGVAIALFAASTIGMRGASRVRGALVVAGAGFPVAVNLVYVGFGVPELDPTPIAMGLGAVSIRWGVPYLVGAPFLAALARSELLDQLDTGILVADRRGRVLGVSRGAREMLPSVEPIGAFLGDLLALFAGDPGYDVRRIPLKRHGRTVGMGAIVSDRRCQRAQERTAEVATRMEALGVLTRGLAHEINNPLGAVIGGTELLAEALREESDVDLHGSQAGRMLRTVEEGGERIAQVVRRMRLLSEVDDDSLPGSAEVRSVAEQAITLACLGKGRDRVKLECPLTLVHAAIRWTDLLQILLHAIGNALESGAETDAPVRVVVEQDDDSVTVRVLDRGPGIPLGDPSRLFHPFFTTRDPGKGLGLGLSLGWELARQNGGRLDALPRDGGGIELRLELATADPRDLL